MAAMLDDWKAAKKDFEKMTGKHKPGPKFMLVFHKSTGIEGALKECDKQLGAKPVDTEKLGKSLEQLVDTSNAYLKELDTAKSKETQDGEYITSMSKAISSLKQSLKKYQAHFQKELDQAKAMEEEGAGLEKMAKVALAGYINGVKAAVAHAKSCSSILQAMSLKLKAGEIKFDAALKFYDQVMNGKEAARKLTTALGGYGQIKKMGCDVSDLKDPKDYINVLGDYSQNTSRPKDVGELYQFVNDFEQRVKYIAKDYK